MDRVWPRAILGVLLLAFRTCASDYVGIGGHAVRSELGRQNATFMVEALRRRLEQPAGGEAVGFLDLAKQLREAMPTNISDTCAQQSLYTLRSTGSQFALQMLDSIGKPSAGFLEGNLYWMGDFDECVNANTGPDAPVVFSGQYCKLSLPFALTGQSLTLQVGACVPSGCSSSDAKALFNTVLLLLGHSNFTQLTADCHPVVRPLDSKARSAIILLSVLAGLVIVGTLCDIAKSVHTSMHSSIQADVTEYVVPVCHDGSRSESREDELTPLLLKKHDSERAPADSDRAALAWQIVTSFSVYKNGCKLLSTGQSQGSLACLNGIRFLSISWVVLGHVYYLNTSLTADLALFLSQTVASRSFQVILNAQFSVDTFFLLSGLLATYLFLREVSRKHGVLSARDWILVYAHRYIRLTPAYAVILMIWTCLVMHFSDGPGWPLGQVDGCSTNWWTNLLYINNIVRPDPAIATGCMDWTWYLANDMQFFMVTPVLAFLLYKHSRAGVAVASLMICGSIASSATVSAVDSYRLGALAGENTSMFNDFYIKPWCRFVPYGMGILLGYAVFAYNGKPALNAFTVVTGWIITAGCCSAVIYAPYEAEVGSRAATATVSEAVAYTALARLAWSMGLAWLIFACSTGHAGWVNTLLSWRPFVQLARLTYCTYLIHPIVVGLYAAASRDLVHLGGVAMVPLFLGMLVISLALAFVASLAFEAPVLAIEKALRERKKIIEH